MTTQRKSARMLSILVKLFLLAVGVMGQWATLIGPGMMHGRALMYFTTQSNLLVMALAMVFLTYDVIGARRVPGWLWLFKYMATVAITLTYLAFHVLLMPWMHSIGMGDYYWSAGNMGAHVLTPLLAIVDWALFTPGQQAARARPAHGLVLPLGYAGFLLIANIAGLTFAGGAQAPYFFVDAQTNGWFSLGNGRVGIVWWMLLIAGLILLIGQAIRHLPRQEDAAAG